MPISTGGKPYAGIDGLAAKARLDSEGSVTERVKHAKTKPTRVRSETSGHTSSHPAGGTSTRGASRYPSYGTGRGAERGSAIGDTC
jgi:hypothetical protein